jgi:hypothetical protein
MLINTFAKLTLISVFSFVCAHGSVISYTDTLPPQLTNWAGAFSVPKFNPLLGTLQKVTLTLDVTVNGNIFLENLDHDAAILNASDSVTVAANTPLGFLITTATTPVSFSATAFDGVQDESGTSGRTFLNMLATVSNSENSTAPLDLAQFTGLGNIVANALFTGHSSVTGNGNLFAFIQTFGGGSLTVVYDFKALETPVPETSSLLGIGLGLSLIGVKKRFFSSRP